MNDLIGNKICFFCNKEISISGSAISKNDTCQSCGNDLHICVNCRFFDESKHNKCTETESEWISDREKRNYCSFFDFKLKKNDFDLRDKSKSELRKRADSLFKK